MDKKYKKAVFMFRRGLRLQDNTGLLHALDSAEVVIPIFILDPKLLEGEYASKHAIQFMFESLEELDSELLEKGSQIYFFKGLPNQVFTKLLKQESGVEAFVVNVDYSKYSKDRDEKLEKICKQNKVDFVAKHDYLLTKPGQVLTSTNDDPYKVFTPFYRAASKDKVREPHRNLFDNYHTGDVEGSKAVDILEEMLPKSERKQNLAAVGGRGEAKKILADIDKFRNYEESRNQIWNDQGTTRLSAHNKFGTVSVREAYYKIKGKLGKDHGLIQELYWRDFFTLIGHYFPYVYDKPFRKEYEQIQWRNNEDEFHAWCEGKTGYPIVDAGMRQLNTIGYMHNRVRMITASFLVKDLLIDWRWGEKYFAEKLVDYDVSVNNGNWQWAASTGTDSQPYFRIFNPWSQQTKYDPEYVYVKEWVEELADVDSNVIKKLEKGMPEQLQGKYPQAIVDHKSARERALQAFKAVKG
jgi:deoxyribodipyrimidine photo-lyase